MFDDVDSELLKAARAAVLVSGPERRDLRADLLSLARDGDTRVRQIIVSAIGRFLELHQAPILEGALLAALCDPDERVVRAAVDATARLDLREPGATDVLHARLRSLFDHSGRDLRQALAAAARERLRLNEDRRLMRLLDDAREDRSWLVRRAVASD